MRHRLLIALVLTCALVPGVLVAQTIDDTTVLDKRQYQGRVESASLDLPLTGWRTITFTTEGLSLSEMRDETTDIRIEAYKFDVVEGTWRLIGATHFQGCPTCGVSRSGAIIQPGFSTDAVPLAGARVMIVLDILNRTGVGARIRLQQ